MESMKGLRTTKPYRWHKRSGTRQRKQSRVTTVPSRNHIPEFMAQDLPQEREEEEEMWEMISEQPQGSIVSISEIVESELESDAVSILSIPETSKMSAVNYQRGQGGGLRIVLERAHLREIPTHLLAIEVAHRLLGLLVKLVRGFLWIVNLVFGGITHLREVRSGERIPRNLQDQKEE